MLIKRKILLENSVDRTYNSPTWGTITADTFYINVFITQNLDNMGLFSDINYFSANTSDSNTVDYSILVDKLAKSGFTYPFMTQTSQTIASGLTETDRVTLRLPNKEESDYYNYKNLVVTGMTDSKLEELKSYDASVIYKVGFNMDVGAYNNYENNEIIGVSKVISTNNPNTYVFDAENDAYIGTSNQKTGLLYSDNTGQTRSINNGGIIASIPITEFSYIGEGQNETNVSLSALTKEEYLFGIISKPEVINDVFIDRGIVSVMDYHLRLSEIKDLGVLTRYGNGFYKLIKQ